MDVAAKIVDLTRVPGIDRRALLAEDLGQQYDLAVEHDLRPAFVRATRKCLVQVEGVSYARPGEPVADPRRARCRPAHAVAELHIRQTGPESC